MLLLTGENTMAKTTKVGEYRIRALNDNANELYFCVEGCGECGKKDVENTVRTTHSPEGVLIERRFEVVEVSTCCGSLVGIWDNVTDDDAVEGYTYTPTQPPCELHAQLRCPKRHNGLCTDSKPCINKGDT